METAESCVLLVDEYRDLRQRYMEFRLIYRGRLPSGTKSRREDRNAIRKFLHPQLKELWRVHPNLAMEGTERIAQNYKRANLPIIPLVTERSSWVCALDILFLRRDPPGAIISGGGDLDNRLKVLFDGLRMPRDAQEIGDEFDDLGGPLFCLLEDDALIVEAKITTDRLLMPTDTSQLENDNHVHLVIHVRTDIIDMAKALVAGFE
jgi:hypothetical protein